MIAYADDGDALDVVVGGHDAGLIAGFFCCYCKLSFVL